MKPGEDTSYRPFPDQGRTTWGSLEDLGPNHISTIARYWLSRSFVAAMTLALMVGTYFEPAALTHQLFDAAGAKGWAVAAVLSVICALALAEVVFNDLLPPAWTVPALKSRRHCLYLGIAFGNAICAFLFVYETGGWYRGVILPYLVIVLFSAAVAYLDLFQRHRAPQK
jgi:hypothetical protein